MKALLKTTCKTMVKTQECEILENGFNIVVLVCDRKGNKKLKTITRQQIFEGKYDVKLLGGK